MSAGEESCRARILHIITLLELGGAQENTLHTVRHLDRRRYEVGLVAGAGGMLDAEARAIPDLSCWLLPELVREVHPARDAAALRALVLLLREWRPDLVHTHSSKAGILGRVAARLAGVPRVVHSIHGFGFTPAQRAPVRAAYIAAERLARPLTDAFIAVSEANLAEGVRLGLFRRRDVDLVRSGIPLEVFADGTRERAAVLREAGLPAGAPLIGGIACLKPQKDPLTFVAVAARVLAEHPAACFVLAGDGELRAEVEARIAALGLGERVRLLGWRRDVGRLMRAFDVLLHTSRWEGLPRVLPQALAAGVPVVATAVDGAPEAVRHGETGWLAPPGDVEALAGAVLRLLREPPLREAMGERGRASVESFELRHLVPGQERLYRRLLEAA